VGVQVATLGAVVAAGAADVKNDGRGAAVGAAGVYPVSGGCVAGFQLKRLAMDTILPSTFYVASTGDQLSYGLVNKPLSLR
jgi:hypothetical protein